MQIIKRKILLENSTSREPDSTYGTLTATSFYFKILLTQNVDDIGLFTDILYIPQSDLSINQPDYTLLINKLSTNGITFPFMSGGTPVSGVTIDNTTTLRLPSYLENDFYNYAFGRVSGYTDSKLDLVKSYSNINPYLPNFYVNSEIYNDYLNNIVNGGDVVINIGEPTKYTFNISKTDINSGTTNQNNGILYSDYTGQTRNIGGNLINITDFNYLGEGWNQTNISLSALTKEEYLWGIVEKPIVESDLFIERGVVTVMENHLRLSEIESLNHLENYGNKFYNLDKI